MNINPNTLKELRKRRALSQADLQLETHDRDKKNRVSLGTIKRIENFKSNYSANPRIVKALSKALGVAPEDLAKEIKDIPQDEETNPWLGRQQLKVSIKNETASSMRMVEVLYGIPVQDQVNMAPLFIALLAEASLKWRKEKLDRIINAVSEISQPHKGHLAFTNQVYRLDDGIVEEQTSIANRDIFGRKVAEDSFAEGFDPSVTNPFADFLREFVNEESKYIKLDIHGDFEIGLNGIPEYTIGKEQFERISDGDPLAKFSLRRGHAKIHKIPKELMTKEMRDERVAWIIDKIPPAKRKKFEASQAEFNAIFAGMEPDFTQEKKE